MGLYRWGTVHKSNPTLQRAKHSSSYALSFYLLSWYWAAWREQDKPKSTTRGCFSLNECIHVFTITLSFISITSNTMPCSLYHPLPSVLCQRDAELWHLAAVLKTDTTLLLLKCTQQGRFYTDRLLSGPESCMHMYDGWVYNVNKTALYLLHFAVCGTLYNDSCHRFSQKHDAYDDFQKNLFLLLFSLFLLQNVWLQMYSDKTIKWWQVKF